MLCSLFVLCLHIFYVTSQCPGEYGSYGEFTATIDLGHKSIWYQTKFPRCVNGKKVAELNAKSLHFSNPGHYSWIEGIFNFTHLEEIYMDQYRLSKVPLLYDMPKIQKIYLSKNNIEEIKSDAFAKVPVSMIVLSRNKISSIGAGAFGDTATQVFLTCNNLTEFSPNWFTNPSVLTIFTIGGNRLSSLPEYAFKSFITLRSINLRNNQIATLGTGAFGLVADFYKINLSYNHISEIAEDAFLAASVSISSFDIQYNRLSFLSDQLLKKLSVESIFMWANPWQCPCEAKIERWLTQQNRTIESQIKRDADPNCVYALTFASKCVAFPDDDLYKEFLKNFISHPLDICPEPKTCSAL